MNKISKLYRIYRKRQRDRTKCCRLKSKMVAHFLSSWPVLAAYISSRMKYTRTALAGRNVEKITSEQILKSYLWSKLLSVFLLFLQCLTALVLAVQHQLSSALLDKLAIRCFSTLLPPKNKLISASRRIIMELVNGGLVEELQQLFKCIT